MKTFEFRIIMSALCLFLVAGCDDTSKEGEDTSAAETASDLNEIPNEDADEVSEVTETIDDEVDDVDGIDGQTEVDDDTTVDTADTTSPDNVDVEEGTPVDCNLTGLWAATFEGTDMGVVNVQFEQNGSTWEAVGNGVDTDEGPFTVRLSGTTAVSELAGEYENDHHWQEGEIDYLGEVDAICYVDLLLGNWRSCTYETVVDGECPTWMWQGRWQAVRTTPDIVEIDTAGCVAAVGVMCVVAAACAAEFPRIPDVEILETCNQMVEDRSEQIENACLDYLTNGVENGEYMAIYLNSASPEHVQSCVDGQSCSLVFITEIIVAYQEFLASEDSTSLSDLLTPLLADCYLQ